MGSASVGRWQLGSRATGGSGYSLVGSVPASSGAPSPTLPLVVSVRNLPMCSVSTNLNEGHVPKDFLAGLTKVIAETLNKAEKSIYASVSTNVRMFKNGSDGPTAVIEIWSIGVFDAERNKKYAKDIFKYITKELKSIPENRIVLLFHPLQAEDAGHLIYLSSK